MEDDYDTDDDTDKADDGDGDDTIVMALWFLILWMNKAIAPISYNVYISTALHHTLNIQQDHF